jgi:hypothetical protein
MSDSVLRSYCCDSSLSVAAMFPYSIICLRSVCVLLFHLALSFDLKVNAAAFAFSVSPVPFSLLPLCCLLSGTCVRFNTREKVSLLLFVVFP